MSEIVFHDVGKTYPDGTLAVRDVSMSVEDGEFLVLVGPSGCGKSTLLRMVAGLERITRGEIRIGGRIVNGVAPKDRDIAMVFQNYALYPHMSVADNIGFGLKLAKVPKAERRARVGRVAEILALTELLDRKPTALSGGQRQRVAMGRAIVREPVAYLMDEPLSNLDAKLRDHMRTELATLHNRLRTTTIYVTHDQVEAMTLGSRVAVLAPVGEVSGSNLQQIAAPEELYARPRNVFVASFIGSPAINLATGTVNHAGGRMSIDVGETRIPVDPGGPLAGALRDSEATRLTVGYRPDDFGTSPPAESTAGGLTRLQVTATFVEIRGVDSYVHFAAPAGSPAPSHPTTGEASAGEAWRVRVAFADSPRVGDRVDLFLRHDRLHLFDPLSGERLN